MKLSSLIEKDLIFVKMKIHSRGEAVQTAVNTLLEKKKLSYKKDELIQEISNRDALGGTVFPTGLAIPHARIKGYGDLAIMICIPETPVMVEEQPVSCFIIMITSLAVSNLYLQVLATLARLSSDKRFFSRLTGAGSVSDVVDLLGEVFVKKDLTVEDIMNKNIISITPEMNVKEVIDRFYQNKTGYLPVISPENKFLGEVRINDLVAIGIPDYAVMIGNLSFLNSFEPFDKLLVEEQNILVSSVMKKALVSLNPGSSVIEAALKMTQGNYRNLPVVANGELVGILSIMDILFKVLRR